MLKSTISKIVKNRHLFLWALLLSMPMMASAANEGLGFGWLSSIPDAKQMLVTFAKNFPPLFNMVAGLAYLFGVTLILSGIWVLRKYGEGVSMVSNRNIHEPLMRLAVGAMLIFAPSTMYSLLATVFGADSPLSYVNHLPDPAWSLAEDTIIIFVQFIGFVAIVRGLLHLHKASSGQSQQNGFAKGIIHLVGGVLSMNIIGTKNMLYATLGLVT